jgi:hypothetical protein
MIHLLPKDHAYILENMGITCTLFREFYSDTLFTDMLSGITEGGKVPSFCTNDYLIVFNKAFNKPDGELTAHAVAFCIVQLTETPNGDVTFYADDLTFKASAALTLDEKAAMVHAIPAWTQEIVRTGDASECFQFDLVFCLDTHSDLSIRVILCNAGFRIESDQKYIALKPDTVFFARHEYLEPSTPSREEPAFLW